MVEGRSRFGFRQEPLPAIWIVRQVARQKLDCCFPFQPGVFGQKNLPHSTGAQFRGDPVMARHLADHSRSFQNWAVGFPLMVSRVEMPRTIAASRAATKVQTK